MSAVGNFQNIGCYAGGAPDTVLKGGKGDGATMTVAECIGEAKANDWQYSGMAAGGYEEDASRARISIRYYQVLTSCVTLQAMPHGQHTPQGIIYLATSLQHGMRWRCQPAVRRRLGP